MNSNEGKTAVLTSIKWGTCVDKFRNDPELINLVIENQRNNYTMNEEIKKYCKDKYNYGIWPNSLRINWIPSGTVYTILHGDEGEYVLKHDDVEWTTAT